MTVLLDWIDLLDWTEHAPRLHEQPPMPVDRSALSPQTWPFRLEWLPASACLVGGSVRDALLGRHGDYLDLDFVLPDQVVETAKSIARHYKAGFVLLDEERNIARAVFPQGTVDFAEQVGDCLESDLRRRDFTVNAIAYNPHTAQFTDPLHGCADLQQRLIRMVSPENLREDPLRLLRAYRQAAQLGFSLEPATRSEIRQLAPYLSQIAAERIQSELNYLLSAANGTYWLTNAYADGLLQTWVPNATEQGLTWLAALDQVMLRLQVSYPAFAAKVLEHPQAKAHRTRSAEASSPSGSARNWLMTAKLACLMPPDPTEAEGQLRRLKYSRNEIQSVCTVLKSLPDLAASRDQAEIAALRQQYQLFQAAGATFPAVAVLALAQGTAIETILPLMQRFLNPDDPVAHPAPLLTGQELMQALNLVPSPQVGKLLAALQLARAEGLITSQGEAIDYARTLLDANT